MLPFKLFSFALVFSMFLCHTGCAKNKVNLIQEISDQKEFKKFLRTRTNVLVLFAKSDKEIPSGLWDVLAEVALGMKGLASVVYVDCSESSKPCKKLKSSTDTYELKHFKDGEFHKVFDRKLTVKSISNFLSNPTGDAPWEEDSDAVDVIHIGSREQLIKTITRERKPILVMFYAPWCGHCKRLKPEFAAAASALKNKAVLAGMDVDKPENYMVRTEYNITGFPTLCYFENSKYLFNYGGENTKDGIIKWIESPTPPAEPVKEVEWSEMENDVVHLTDATFDEQINSATSVLVMFYAPWCGHCKKMKPEYEQAATQMKSEQIDGIIAAVDATKETKVAKKFDVKGYPTVKYFKNGQFAWDVNERTADKIVEFMKNPVEPAPPPAEESDWESVASAVVHLSDDTFKSFIKKKKHVLVMFYAPWCGHCKKAKPEFSSAAEHFNDNKIAFAAIDCTKYSSTCTNNDVSGYPTFKYFNYGKNDIKYTGGRERDAFVRFMSDPLSPLSLSPATPTPEEQWQLVDSANNIRHLTELTFDPVLQQQRSALVVFYAPWCGHCKALKPAYAEAAAILKENKYDGILAAVDATVERSLQTRFSITGFPTLKYFIYGVESSTYNLGRTAQDFVAFMKTQLEKQGGSDVSSQTATNRRLNGSKQLADFLLAHQHAAVLFYPASNCEADCQLIKTAFLEVSAQVDDAAAVATFECGSNEVTEAVEHCTSVKPSVRYFTNGKFTREYSGSGSVESLTSFIQGLPQQKQEL